MAARIDARALRRPEARRLPRISDLAQKSRARRAGQVIVSTVMDRPWSRYCCCMLAGGQRFVREYPVASKRVLRALLNAADLCASQPARVAQQLVDGVSPRGMIARCKP
jgi:ABC-type nitrate/sulfonate/bicarbonate transport system substrate-binding protein